jgi:hypothetical protein
LKWPACQYYRSLATSECGPRLQSLSLRRVSQNLRQELDHNWECDDKNAHQEIG